MLIEVLPNATIVSIGHRSTLIALHRRHLEMVPREGGSFEPIPTMKAEIFGGRAARDFR
jgi:putative ATP-binding cassette transporter